MATGMFSSECPQLLRRHFDHLHAGSGISIEVINDRGYRSVSTKKELADAGFAPSQQNPPGILMPVHSPEGEVVTYGYRPDEPRAPRGKQLKYEFPKGGSMRIDVPPRCLPDIGNPTVPLWITEGQKKADALASHGLCAVALFGVWGFKGRNNFGGTTILADFDRIALNAGRHVNTVFDSDVTSKKEVQDALGRLGEHTKRKGAKVSGIYLPGGPNGDKVGVDDYLLNHTVDELQALRDQPPPAEPEPVAPRVEWLDEAPHALTRPLARIDDHTYAATWIHQKIIKAETVNKDGDIIKHSPPLEVVSKDLFVIRDDGVLFGPQQKKTISDLGIQVRLEASPADSKLWSSRGVAAYAGGGRPDAADVFRRVASVYDKFLDFARSIAKQPEMAEMSACFSLATWFHHVYTVLGIAWPSGGFGSGKTKWGNCWAMTSYLGEVVLASTTFPVLRDSADMGAALMFDDAENLADPKRSEPDKRALLLAGNRLGATVGFKEPNPNGKGWTTRYVNAFCPRGLAAIRIPDAVLGSRSITIPLARTNNHKKANADPAKETSWPCNRRQLIDDLWRIALSLMAEAEKVWDGLDDEEEALGREFEPWRAIIAVARLFEKHGVHGLESRMRKVMKDYHREKAEIGTGDWTVQVIKALMAKAGLDDSPDTKDASDTADTKFEVTAKELADIIKSVPREDDDADTDHWATPTRVGRILRQLRLTYVRSNDRTRSRRWTTTRTEVSGIAQSYALLASLGHRPDVETTDLPIPKHSV